MSIKYNIYVERMHSCVEVSRNNFLMYLHTYLNRDFKEDTIGNTKYVFWYEGNATDYHEHAIAYTEESIKGEE